LCSFVRSFRSTFLMKNKLKQLHISLRPRDSFAHPQLPLRVKNADTNTFRTLFGTIFALLIPHSASKSFGTTRQPISGFLFFCSKRWRTSAWVRPAFFRPNTILESTQSACQTLCRTLRLSSGTAFFLYLLALSKACFLHSKRRTPAWNKFMGRKEAHCLQYLTPQESGIGAIISQLCGNHERLLRYPLYSDGVNAIVPNTCVIS
jgi:hypothetical protein